jgi:uncharacterized phage-like protein YoqJ
MKVAVVGSRGITNKEMIFGVLENYDITSIVSGGAIGVDTIAEEYANSLNIQTEIFLPDWKQYGRAAGIIRNRDIIENSQMTIAFWDGESKGTLSSIKHSWKLKHPTELWIIQNGKI